MFNLNMVPLLYFTRIWIPEKKFKVGYVFQIDFY